MVLEEVEEVVVEVVDLVVVEALVGVEEDHSRAMELQEDDDVCRPWREGEDGGGLLLRVDASLVLEPHQPSLVGNVTSALALLVFPFFPSGLEFPYFLPFPFFMKVSLTLVILLFSISFISVDL